MNKQITTWLHVKILKIGIFKWWFNERREICVDIIHIYIWSPVHYGICFNVLLQLPQVTF